MGLLQSGWLQTSTPQSRATGNSYIRRPPAAGRSPNPCRHWMGVAIHGKLKTPNPPPAPRYRVFKQIDGVDAVPVNVNTVNREGRFQFRFAGYGFRFAVAQLHTLGHTTPQNI